MLKFIKKLFPTERLTPIELHDDGLRVVAHGKTKHGGFDYSLSENPSLIGSILALRKERQMTLNRNFRRWA